MIAMYEMQRRFDLLHHKFRVMWLQKIEKRNDFQEHLLKQSLSIIQNPVHGYHSVDLDDTEYLRVLTDFEAGIERE
jgi:hypothetical protein